MATKTLAKLFLLLILSEVLLVSDAAQWDNIWHQSFHIHCHNSHSLNLWLSHHRNDSQVASDRIHYFRCKPGPAVYSDSNCAETLYVNNYGQWYLSFKCPNNGFIAGVRSVYYSGDRRFVFRCCNVAGYARHTCVTTLYQNNFRQLLFFMVPSNYFLVGVRSVHNSYYKDRAWRFEICTYTMSGK